MGHFLLFKICFFLPKTVMSANKLNQIVLGKLFNLLKTIDCSITLRRFEYCQFSVQHSTENLLLK